MHEASAGNVTRKSTVDPQFLGILLVWSLCVLSQALCIRGYGLSLPYCDEWELMPAAASHAPLTWEMLWTPANEHRAPLTRLALFLLGRHGQWDWQVVHYANLASLASGALALVLAARAIRGRSAMSDAFLCLVVLSPWHFESVIAYGYAYAIATGWTCVVMALAASRWPVQSTGKLILYCLAVLAVAVSEGPAGNLFALGLCGVLIWGLFAGTTFWWKVWGAAGICAVGAVSAAMLLSIPDCPWHASMRSGSVLTLLSAWAQLSVCWMGEPLLQAVWPWALAVLLVPGFFVVAHAVSRARAARRPNGRAAAPVEAWWDLGLLFLAALLVVAAMAYGRGSSTGLWASRYATFTMPVGIIGYLIVVRQRALRMIPQMLALWMALCVGWCWPLALYVVKLRHEQIRPLVWALKRGDAIVSSVGMQYCGVLGLPPARIGDMQDYMLRLRASDLSVFGPINRSQRRSGQSVPQSCEAEAGTLGGGLRVVSDPQATGRHAIEAVGDESGTATYVLDLAHAGAYRLWCRMRTMGAGQALILQIDDGETIERPLPDGPDYAAVPVEVPLRLSAGKHKLVFHFRRAGTRMDVLELIARTERPRR
jgi:hypothetical protein